MRNDGKPYINHYRYHQYYLILKFIEKEITTSKHYTAIGVGLRYDLTTKFMQQLSEFGLIREIHPYIVKQLRPDFKPRFHVYFVVTDKGAEYIKHFDIIESLVHLDAEGLYENDRFILEGRYNTHKDGKYKPFNINKQGKVEVQPSQEKKEKKEDEYTF